MARRPDAPSLVHTSIGRSIPNTRLSPDSYNGIRAYNKRRKEDPVMAVLKSARAATVNRKNVKITLPELKCLKD